MITTDKIAGILSSSFLKEKKMNKKCIESIGKGRGHMGWLRFGFGIACFALWMGVFCLFDLSWTTKAMAEEVRTSHPGSKEKLYGHYDPMRILHTFDNGRHSLDMRYLDTMIADLIVNAGSYPVRFDSVYDRQRAAKDAWQLSGMLDILVKDPKPMPDILLRSGIVNSIGHNLDIKGAPERASEAFEKLLAIDSSHAQGNYWYGVFLSGSGRPKMSLPFLRKAISAGVTDAYYTMGLTVLSLGEKDKALEYLETYRQKKPGDTRATVLIEKIRNGKIPIMKN